MLLSFFVSRAKVFNGFSVHIVDFWSAGLQFLSSTEKQYFFFFFSTTKIIPWAFWGQGGSRPLPELAKCGASYEISSLAHLKFKLSGSLCRNSWHKPLNLYLQLHKQASTLLEGFLTILYSSLEGGKTTSVLLVQEGTSTTVYIFEQLFSGSRMYLWQQLVWLNVWLEEMFVWTGACGSLSLSSSSTVVLIMGQKKCTVLLSWTTLQGFFLNPKTVSHK